MRASISNACIADSGLQDAYAEAENTMHFLESASSGSSVVHAGRFYQSDEETYVDLSKIVELECYYVNNLHSADYDQAT